MCENPTKVWSEIITSHSIRYFLGETDFTTCFEVTKEDYSMFIVAQESFISDYLDYQRWGNSPAIWWHLALAGRLEMRSEITSEITSEMKTETMTKQGTWVCF